MKFESYLLKHRISKLERESRQFRYKGDYFIISDLTKDCVVCKEPSRFISISFESTLCSTECTDIQWEQYTRALVGDDVYDLVLLLKAAHYRVSEVRCAGYCYYVRLKESVKCKNWGYFRRKLDMTLSKSPYEIFSYRAENAENADRIGMLTLVKRIGIRN
jgi:hypothetical protein